MADPKQGNVGGPTDPDIAALPPDPGMLVSLLAHEAYVAEDDHLTIRGDDRWLYVNERGAWALTASPRVKIDAGTVARLRALDVMVDRRQLVIGPERYELVPREVAGSTWAVLEPTMAPPGESA